MNTLRLIGWIAVLWTAVLLLAAMATYAVINPANAAVDPTPANPAAPIVLDVRDDPGGNVVEYYKGYRKLSEQGATIRFHGYCASACTMVLFREYTGIKACADEDAIFAFHKPYMFDAHQKIVKTKKAVRFSRAIWAEWLASFPYDVYTLLKDAHIPSASEGDSPNDMFVVPAIFFLPKCTVAAQ